VNIEDYDSYSLVEVFIVQW